MIIRDRSRFRRLAKEGSWVIAGQVATVVGSLVLVRVLTEHLEPAQYGELALGLTIAGLVNQVVMGGVTAGIGRYYAVAVEEGDLWGYIKSSLRLMGYATLAVTAIGLFLMGVLLLTNQSHWLALVVTVLVFAVLSGFNASLSGVQNAARQRSIVALHSGMNAWLKIGLAVGVILWLGTSSVAVVIGYVLAALLVTASQLFFLRRLIHKQANTMPVLEHENWVPRIWAYSWPFSTWGAFSWAQQVSDRWALETFATTYDVGQYAVVFQLGYAPIGLITGMTMSFLGPILYQRSGAAIDPSRNASVHRLAWRITGLSLAVTGIGFLFTLLLHEWIFQFLVGASFRASSRFLPWVVLAGGIFAAGQMLALKLMSEMRPAAMTTAKTVTALVGVGVNMLGAWYFGIAGVVAGLLIFSALYLVWMTWLAQNLPKDFNVAVGYHA